VATAPESRPEPDDVPSPEEVVFSEARWPIAAALITYIVVSVALRVLIPRRESIGPHWLVPGIEIALLVALLAADPARISRRRRWLRPVATALILLLVAMALLSSAILIVELITGSKLAQSADSLLTSGSLVYFGNALIFGLLYWHLDGGGPLARYRRERAYPDFAFSQQLNPELAPPAWTPKYADYLMLGVTTSTAFSPTDVMPMAPWAKLTMGVQSLISLAVLGLVIARAVNVFS
jgi:hypothetical protein